MKKISLSLIAVAFAINFSYAQNTDPWPTTGNIGIGTTTPKGILGLGDQAKVVETSGITLGNANSSVEFVGSPFGLGYGHKIYSQDPGNGAVDLRVAIRQGTTSWTDAMTIRSNNGNVGIGTTSPAQKLTILMDASTNGTGVAVQAVNSGAAGSQPGFALLNPSAAMRMNSYLDVSSDTYNIGNAAGSALMTINQSGNVGVGTTGPLSKLTVYGSGSLGGANGFGGASTVTEAVFSTDAESLNMGPSIGFGSANKYSGATNPYLYGVIRGAKESATTTNDYAGYLAFYTQGATSVTDERLRISSTGNVGIGTTSPDQKLTVKGTIHSQEVIVDMSVLPDYVFKPAYRLPTLTEIKAYIDQNHRLPEMPSAEQAVKDGLSLGDMNAKLLKKVEELTLYLIEKDSEVKAQQEDNKSLHAEIDELKRQVSTLIKSKP